MKTGYSYLYENIKLLPPDLGDVVWDFDFTKAFETLGGKYKLHLDQSNVVQNLTFQMMFGDISPEEFTKKLISDAALSSDSAKELITDVNSIIIDPIKELLAKRTASIAEMYEDDEPVATQSSPSPQPFHPKSIYNEPITENAPIVHHIAPIHETKLTQSDVLHGIENPHPSIGGNSPIRTASGSKSYADIMGGSTTTKPVYPQPVVETKPTPPPTPVPAPKVDLIAMKSSSVVVSAPNKIETLPVKAADILPTDPYKESV